MRLRSLAFLALLAAPSALLAAAPEFNVADGWLKPPAEMPTIGPAHGDVAVSLNGDVYVSILSGPRGGVQVYDAQGKYLRNVPGAPNDFHGFVIRKDADGEHIYGSQLGGQKVLKMKLDGTTVLTIEASAFPDEFKNKGKDGKSVLRLTAVDVAPDGRIFVVDGYSSDYIHVFEKDGKYQKSFGGKKAPYGFKTNHKICIDTRFNPPRIICCDRENRRVVNLSIDGEVLSIVPDMKRPAAVAVFGDWAAVGEIEGRVSLIDKDNKVVKTLGANDVKGQTATNAVKPEDWRPGILTAPHGVAFDSSGDLFVTEYNLFGRVLRYNAGK